LKYLIFSSSFAGVERIASADDVFKDELAVVKYRPTVKNDEELVDDGPLFCEKKIFLTAERAVVDRIL
jgi:hypothetical protein